MEHKLTTERIIKAAEESPEAAKLLETLFPEVFEDNTVYCKIGSIFSRTKYPDNIYVLFKWVGEVRVLNVTGNRLWKSGKNLKVYSLKDPTGETLSVAEFKKLTGMEDLSEFKWDPIIKFEEE